MVPTKNYLDDSRWHRVVIFFNKYLRHIKGEYRNRPLYLSDWQINDIIKPFFGTVSQESGKRVYRSCYLEIPRKNGKSTIAAGIALYLLFSDGEPGAEVYSCASDRDQASIVFGLAKSMVQMSPALSSKAKIYRRHIALKKGDSFYKVVSADARRNHGFNSHGVIFDELHTQPNRDLYDAMVTSTGSRSQPVFFAITTAGLPLQTSICYQVHNYAKVVERNLSSDPTFLPVIYSADVKEDWTKEEIWRKANPGYGVSIKAEYFHKMVAEAISLPSNENTFRRLHLNQWVTQDVRWLPMHEWEKCNGGNLRIEDFRELPCYIGLDLSSTTDITAMSLVFFDEENALIHTFCEYWVPRASIKRRSEKDKIPYDLWAREGKIHEVTTHDGKAVDHDVIVARIAELSQALEIQCVSIDRWMAAYIINKVDDLGLDVIKVGQGYVSMSAPTKFLLGLILARKFRYYNDDVLTWMAANMTVEMDAAGNIKPSKRKSVEKIDGIVATIMSLSAILEGHGPSVYEDRNLLGLSDDNDNAK